MATVSFVPFTGVATMTMLMLAAMAVVTVPTLVAMTTAMPAFATVAAAMFVSMGVATAAA
ncbi:hypothetical protein APHAL10511_001799 [Amanita phalloides]|nr:hypothetical protein APHAL10511_001799 [Amanita phalloides]